MRTVIVGIGIPGSGKTTYLKPLAERYGFVYVAPDDIRAELTGDAADNSRDEETWDLARARIALALEQGRSVVVDATFRIRRYRREFMEFLRAAGAQTVLGIYADTPLAVAQERNRSRERIVPQDVLERMHASLTKEPPSIEDGFDAVVTLDAFAVRERQLLS